MDDERRPRLALRASLALLVIAGLGAAIVPGPAWSPGSAALAEARALDGPRVLHVETGLTVAPHPDGVLVATGDGGGAGPIAGLGDGVVRVRPGAFRGAPCWEIGSAPGRPATYVNDNGVRLDDGMTDRLRTRAWPLPALLALAGVVVAIARMRRAPSVSPWAPPALFALATAALVVSFR